MGKEFNNVNTTELLNFYRQAWIYCFSTKRRNSQLYWISQFIRPIEDAKLKVKEGRKEEGDYNRI